MDDSLKSQTKEALKNGATEIERLRQVNEVLAIKAQAFDALSGLVGLLTPRPSQGYAPDAAWILRSLLAKIEGAEKMAPNPNGDGQALVTTQPADA